MDRLIKIDKQTDILEQYRNTPIEHLLKYHNLACEFQTYTKAELLIGMCMDNRKSIRIPDNFAYIIRSGGGNLRYSEFKVSYAIAVGGVSAIALVAHTNCGMVKLNERRQVFIDGLVTNAGWDYEMAEEQFEHFAPLFEINNEIDFVLSESVRLKIKYPKVIVAPLLYRVEDNRLYMLRE